MERARPVLNRVNVVGSDLDATLAFCRRLGDMISAGYRGLQPPHDAFWGARYAILEDPDGLAIGLMSPISAAHRAPSPQV